MLPPESVVVLNIPYWGAGVQPWCLGSGHKDFPHAPSISDQKLEVFCVYSSFHIAQMQVKNHMYHCSSIETFGNKTK